MSRRKWRRLADLSMADLLLLGSTFRPASGAPAKYLLTEFIHNFGRCIPGRDNWARPSHTPNWYRSPRQTLPPSQGPAAPPNACGDPASGEETSRAAQK